ncbi:MAG: hypothetical protein R2784_19940 [Saprospiraceae bacterium]
MEALGAPIDSRLPEALQKINKDSYYEVTRDYNHDYKYNGVGHIKAVKIFGNVVEHGYYAPLALPLEEGNLADYPISRLFKNAPDFYLDSLISVKTEFYNIKENWGRVKLDYPFDIDRKEDRLLYRVTFSIPDVSVKYPRLTERNKEKLEEIIKKNYASWYAEKNKEKLKDFSPAEIETFKKLVADEYVRKGDYKFNIEHPLAELEKLTKDEYEKFKEIFTLPVEHQLIECNQIYIASKHGICAEGDCQNGKGKLILPYLTFEGHFLNGKASKGIISETFSSYTIDAVFREDGLLKHGKVLDKQGNVVKELDDFANFVMNEMEVLKSATLTHEIYGENKNYKGTMKGITSLEAYEDGVISYKVDGGLISFPVKDGVEDRSILTYSSDFRELEFWGDIKIENGDFVANGPVQVAFPRYLEKSKNASVLMEEDNIWSGIFKSKEAMKLVYEVYKNPKKIDGPIFKSLYEAHKKEVHTNGSFDAKRSLFYSEYSSIIEASEAEGTGATIAGSYEASSKEEWSFYIVYLGDQANKSICLELEIKDSPNDLAPSKERKCVTAKYFEPVLMTIKMPEVKSGNNNSGYGSLTVKDPDKKQTKAYKRTGKISANCSSCNLNEFLVFQVKGF